MEKTLLSIVLILLATKIGGIISKKLKMPEVLGALLGGVVLGPLVLNLVHYDSNIKLLSDLGVIMLMFLAGIETDVKEFKKAGLSSFLIALAGIMLPLIFGTLGAYIFFNKLTENVFVGVILTATSVSITAETLKELGKLNTRAGINILGAAVIDDVLGLMLISIVLAVVQSSGSGATGSGLLSLLLVFIKIVLFCVFSVIAVVYLPKYIDKYATKMRQAGMLLTFSLAAALFVAYIAESVGIAGITGAYVCGLVLSSLDSKEYLERSVKAISSGFLSLVFFASVGIEADLSGMNREAAFITLVMFIIAVVGKIVGCGAAARALKMSRSEAIQIGVGMVSRGEVAIITANIGLQKGIISQEVFLPTLVVVILTTIVTPILLKESFSHKIEKRI